jgi:hypothetical protein
MHQAGASRLSPASLAPGLTQEGQRPSATTARRRVTTQQRKLQGRPYAATPSSRQGSAGSTQKMHARTQHSGSAMRRPAILSTPCIAHCSHSPRWACCSFGCVSALTAAVTAPCCHSCVCAAHVWLALICLSLCSSVWPCVCMCVCVCVCLCMRACSLCARLFPDHPRPRRCCMRMHQQT